METPVLLLLTVTPLLVHSVQISKVWVPEPFREGSRSSVLLDCVYNYTMEDRDSLEVKWYFRQGLNPIYQWVPPNPPQVSKQVGLTPYFGVKLSWFCHMFAYRYASQTITHMSR